MNIAAQHVDNLVRLGYTPEEARFIYVAATHSGYFTHRQFLMFSGTKPGKHSQKFLTKLLSQKHATYHTYPSGGRVYHIFARKVFRALERDDLRTRRRHQLDYIKTRLVTLDFVLGNLDCQYLETEVEKVLFFESRFNINRSLLPCKMYTSKASSSSTFRYFVDRFPIFVREASTGSSVVCLSYVAASSVTLQGFVTHLQAYRGLLRSLPQFEFLYIAPTDRVFKGAGIEFSRIVLASKGAASKDQILRYFDLRKRWEAGERVAASDVVFLNAARSELRDARVELQYRKWTEDAINNDEITAHLGSPAPQVHGTLVPQKCGESLCVFYRSHGGSGERPDDKVPDTYSPSVSPEGLQL
jgi:hypothetical protein